MAQPLFPFVLNEQFQAQGDAATMRDIGHGLKIGLVVDAGDMIGGITSTSLEKAGVTLEDAYDVAITNLHQLLVNGTLKSTVYQDGPNGEPFAVFDGHWAAASTVIYPTLGTVFGPQFGENLLLAIPHRDAMVLFADRDPDQYADIDAFLREKFSDGEQPLTFGLFRLDANGLHAV